MFDFVGQEGALQLFQAGSLGNQRVEVLDALTEESNFQRISTNFQSRTAYSRVLKTTFPLVDASFLRLKTFSLTYNLPSSISRYILSRNAKIFLNGQNLFTLTKYDGIDPKNSPPLAPDLPVCVQ